MSSDPKMLLSFFFQDGKECLWDLASSALLFIVTEVDQESDIIRKIKILEIMYHKIRHFYHYLILKKNKKFRI